MNGYSFRLLEWSYPLALWLIVAFFSLLACRNVIAVAAIQPVSEVVQTQLETAVPSLEGSAYVSANYHIAVQ